jgi:hypothetical protein
MPEHLVLANSSVLDWGSSTITFWKDNPSDVVLAKKYPRLLPFALDVNIVSVKPTLEAEHLDDLFQLSLSEQAFIEPPNAIVSVKIEESQKTIIPRCETWVPLGPHQPGSWTSPTSGSGLLEDPPT